MDDRERRDQLIAWLQQVSDSTDGRSAKAVAVRKAIGDFLTIGGRKSFPGMSLAFASLRHEFEHEPQGDEREAWVLYNAALDIVERGWLALQDNRPLPHFGSSFDRWEAEQEERKQIERARLEHVAGFEDDMERLQVQLRADQGLAADGGPKALPHPPMPVFPPR